MGPTRSLFYTLFSKYLPPPRYLQMPAVGLDISDEAIRFVDLEKRSGTYRLKAFDKETLPPDTIEEGFIKNKEAIIAGLQNLKKKHGIKYVKASLPEEKAYIFKTEVPIMDLADIRGAVRFKLEENVPVHLEDAVFDYHLMREPLPGEDHINLGVAVVHIKVVQSFFDAITAAGLVPLEFRIESQAIAHAVLPERNEDTHIVIAIRETRTVLAIVSRGIIRFSSTVSIGGQSILESIKKNFSVNEEEAKKIRAGAEKKEGNEMFLSLVNAISVLRDEIQKLFVYWDTRDDTKRPIKDILICGADVLLGIDEYLARSIEVPVRVADVWTNIQMARNEVPPINYRDSLDYASALGLALSFEDY